MSYSRTGTEERAVARHSVASKL